MKPFSLQFNEKAIKKHFSPSKSYFKLQSAQKNSLCSTKNFAIKHSTLITAFDVPSLGLKEIPHRQREWTLMFQVSHYQLIS